MFFRKLGYGLLFFFNWILIPVLAILVFSCAVPVWFIPILVIFAYFIATGMWIDEFHEGFFILYPRRRKRKKNKKVKSKNRIY